jgi:2-dehydropantoate 2-reductase
MTAPLVCIYGAGSIGCYVGGRLMASGARVQLIARRSVGEQLQTHGLHVSDYRGARFSVDPENVAVDTEPEAARNASLVLVTVKSAATEQAARELARVLPASAIVLSLQNGLHNARVLARALPGRRVLAGMVLFNVVQRGAGFFHQGSEGGLEAEYVFGMEPFAALFERAGVPLVLRRDLERVQWAKLLLNLNNPINALSDLPLRDELGQRAFRQCLALAQAEALEVLTHANKQLARLTPLPPTWIPRLLGVPDMLFEWLGRKTLAIDPLARSSMWEDLQRGRVTEVDYINGEVVELARTLGRNAPVNARLVTLIRAAENGGRRRWSAPELLAELRRAQRG